MYDPYFQSLGGFRGDELVLDFGCGGGVGTRCIAARLNRGGRVTGVDSSVFFTARAGKRLAGCTNARILHGQITELDLAPESFDLISIIQVIHDIGKDQRAAAIQALGTLLKRGGRLWIWEPTRCGHGMQAAEIRRLMQEAGLREISSQEQGSAFKGTFER